MQNSSPLHPRVRKQARLRVTRLENRNPAARPQFANPRGPGRFDLTPRLTREDTREKAFGLRESPSEPGLISPSAARNAKAGKGDLLGQGDPQSSPTPGSVSPRPPDSRRLAHHSDPPLPLPSPEPPGEPSPKSGGAPRLSPRRVGSRSPNNKDASRSPPPAGPRLASTRPRCGSGPSAPSPRPAAAAQPPRRLTHLHRRGRSQGVGLKGPGENLRRRAVLHGARSAMPPPPPESPGLRARPAEQKGRGLRCRRRDQERRQRPRGPARAPSSPPRAGPAPPRGLAFC